ncbi:hypothetical protein [Spirosoma validum]|uniref:T9SS type A sorting domain-containing protein n=1 Tax=Spirosoma validum TaxID=2771355 RepID=A0A927GCZ8_9BACT|nr:hypothetical protein [Spirosoma validum]MBD2753277.1 hypothetical protein [Spirosoma validum]
MKTLITSLLFALAIAGSSISFAQDGNALADLTPITQTTVRPVLNGKVDVVVGKTDSNLLIEVVDQQGRTLANKSINKQVVPSRIRFDLRELPDGVYELVITEGNTRQVSDIVLNTHTSATYRTVTMS